MSAIVTNMINNPDRDKTSDNLMKIFRDELNKMGNNSPAALNVIRIMPVRKRYG